MYGGIMGDIIGDFSGFISSFMMALAQMWMVIIAAGFILIGLIYLYIIHKRFPVRKVYLYDRGAWISTTRRQVGGMLVKAGLLDLVLHANKLFGPRIDSFQFVRVGKENYYLAKLGAGNTLIPLKINEQEHSIDEISALGAKALATTYINSMDEVRETIEKSNPFWTALIGTLPLAIVLLLVFALFWSMTDFIMKSIKEVVNPLTDISHQIALYNNQTLNTTTTTSTQNGVSNNLVPL
jgi:hypothetical protein